MSEDKKTIVKMAHIYTQEGRWDKAVNEYKKLLKLDPEDFNTYSVLGDAYVKKGELQPAFDAYLVCSDAYVRLGQLEKAALAQSKIARLDPAQLKESDRAKQAVFKKQVEGDKAMEAGELDKAIEAYQDVLKLDRDRFDLYQKLGDLYLRKGETEAACAKYLEIGNIYFTNKLYKKAAPIFLKVVELDPEQVDAHSALAEIQAKSGNESEAKKEFITLTEFLFQRGDYDRAFQFAQRAEALKAIESYNYIGHVLLRRGKLDEAKGWFEKLLKFKLNHAGALWGMGLWYFEKGQFDEAQKNMAKVPAAERFYAETQVSLGAVYEKMGKPAEAIEAYQIGASGLRKKGLVEPAKLAEAKIEDLGGVIGASTSSPAPAPAAAELSQVEAPQSAPEPGPTPAPVTVEAAAPAPPPLPAVVASAPAALPPLPVVAAPEQAAHAPVDPDEEIATLVSLAESQEEEGDFDGALSLYQSIIDQFPADPRGKQGLARVYAKVGKGAVAATPGAVAAPAADELNKLASMKAEAEAEQAKAQAAAAQQAEERAKAEAAAKLAAEERAKKEMEALQKNSGDSAAKAVAEAEARFRAETEKRVRAEIEARQAAESEAKRQAEVAAQQVDEMRKRMEAEIRQQLEAQMRKEMEEQMRSAAEEGVRKKVEEARLAAEAEAKKSAEAEIRRQFEEERKKLENQESDAKKRMEDELRQRLTLEIQQKKDAEARQKVQAVQTKEEEASRKKIQSDVLARVQAQQKEKMAPLQRTIDEIRRKVEEQQAANAAAAATTSVGAGSPRPAPAPTAAPAPAAPKAAAKPAADDELDDMDPFMNAAVADIYVKQGLVKEAIRIYEKILKLDPNNAEIRGKLDAAQGKPTAAPKAAPSAPIAAEAPETPGLALPKKSKVSYL